MGYEVKPRREWRCLIELLNSRFNITVRRFIRKLTSLIEIEKFLTIHIFPRRIPQLISYFSSPVPDFLIKLWRNILYSEYATKRENYARQLTSLWRVFQINEDEINILINSKHFFK